MKDTNNYLNAFYNPIKTGAALLLIAMALIAFFTIVTTCVFLITDEAPVDTAEAVVIEEAAPSYLIFLDKSAKTGFMTSPGYDARFEGLDYPIAGSDEFDTVYLIDIFKYPSVDPVTFRVDSWDEAVEVLETLGAHQ